MWSPEMDDKNWAPELDVVIWGDRVEPDPAVPDVLLGYSKLPEELRERIWGYAIKVLSDMVSAEVASGARDGSFAANMFDYIVGVDVFLIRRTVLSHVRLWESAQLDHFIERAPTKAGVKASVVNLTIDGRGLVNGLDWGTFLDVRATLHVLKTIKLTDVIVHDTRIDDLVNGLDKLSLHYCNMSFSTLLRAISGVPVFSGQENDVDNVVNTIEKKFVRKFKELHLAAMSQHESHTYSLVLARVSAVEKLVLQGVEKGWRLADGWDSVKYLSCDWGLPSYSGLGAAMERVFVTVSAHNLEGVQTLMNGSCRCAFGLTVDVPFDWSPANLWRLWHILETGLEADSFSVILHIDKPTPTQLAGSANPQFNAWTSMPVQGVVTVVVCPASVGYRSE